MKTKTLSPEVLYKLEASWRVVMGFENIRDRRYNQRKAAGCPFEVALISDCSPKLRWLATFTFPQSRDEPRLQRE